MEFLSEWDYGNVKISLTAEGKIESPLSHSSTNYSRWYHSNESYEVKNYQDKYEPYLILRFGNILYHINYSVIQGFPALRKAVTTHVKNYDIFSRVFDIANQLLTRHSPFAPLGQVDKWTAKPSRFSIHLTRSLRSPVSYELKTRREILHLRAPMLSCKTKSKVWVELSCFQIGGYGYEYLPTLSEMAYTL